LSDLIRLKNGALGREDFDIVYAFFQSSHHLRDWMVNSNAASKDECRDLWDSSFALRLGEDICNNSKHYERIGRVRVAAHLGFQRSFTPNDSGYGETWYVVWVEEGLNDDQSQRSDIRRFELRGVVNECMTKWREFCDPRLMTNLHSD
jgi:hypothetical protein